MFEVESQESFAEREEQILAFWQKEQIFQRSLEQRKGSPLFSFYDGPPFATGLPHYGHILAGTIKDVVPRYKAMQGFYVPRRFGWDCHGLPVENEIEKGHELSGASAIEVFGIARFNEECRNIVLRYTEEWKKTVSRMGRWVDFSQTYRTMDLAYMESVWSVFAKLYEEGLVYEGFKVMPFSARLGTPLSNFEANLNYKEVDDPSLTVAFALQGDPHTQFLVWTTTPWTLPANLALAVGSDIDYVKVRRGSTCYILAKQRLSQYFKDEYELIETSKGSDLVGLRYTPLFPYFAEQREKTAFRVLADPFVSLEEGTGIVHMAPAFGEVDFFTCAQAEIELVCPVDQNGKFTDEVTDYVGLFVKDADREIIKRLKREGKVFHHGQIRHRYPFCWRSDTPLIYKAVRTWFVAVEKIKEKMLAANAQIRWVPEHIKEGRFGKWLENARDWAISRNRYWGTPIPIWRSGDGTCRVIGTISQLEALTGQKVTDLHRHYIDDLTFTVQGETFRRIPEVFDCWFESGSMPYAQDHYLFREGETAAPPAGFPADFIAEGLDQTRGWFYTLMVLSSALFHEPAFKNVIVNGILLAKDGAKMSKRLKNYPEPDVVIDTYGADAVRLYLLQSPAVVAEDLRFCEKGVEQVVRQMLIPLWNSYVFLATYARIYSWWPAEKRGDAAADLDRWILSRLQGVIHEVSCAMDDYKLNRAIEPLNSFIEQLTNWYIRRSRSRFWSDEESSDRTQAFETLYTVLITLSQVIAPFIPFLSDAIYQKLRMPKDPLSVHLCNYPKVREDLRAAQLEVDMSFVQTVVTIGHALRKEHKLRVRQPLAGADIICTDEKVLEGLQRQQHLIQDELNVKKITLHPDETSFVQFSAKPNFRQLGKKVGKLMEPVHRSILNLDQKELQKLLGGESIELVVEGELIPVTLKDVAVERRARPGMVAKTIEGLTVALDTQLTEELLLEGLARELINKINTMRRDEGYEVTDRIEVNMETTPRVERAFNLHRDLICHEVLAAVVAFGPCQGTTWDLNGEPAAISLKKRS